MTPWAVEPSDTDPILSQPRLNLPAVARETGDEDTASTVISDEMDAAITVPAEVQATVPSERRKLWWRPSGTFRRGRLQDPEEPIPKQKPRTRITYRGVATVQDEDTTVNLWLPGGEYLVKEQPFVKTPPVSLDAIPREQNLERIRSTTLLGWGVILQEDLLTARAQDVAHCIHAQLYVDGERVSRHIFDTTTTGGFLCFPILGKHVGETHDLALRLWISGGPAKTTQYAEAVRHLEVSVVRDEGKLDITVGGDTCEVQNQSDGTKPVLEAFTDTLQRGEFENQTRAESSDLEFRIQSYDPLEIHPEKMLLLHFTDE
jgi:hypothetical protein